MTERSEPNAFHDTRNESVGRKVEIDITIWLR